MEAQKELAPLHKRYRRSAVLWGVASTISVINTFGVLGLLYRQSPVEYGVYWTLMFAVAILIYNARNRTLRLLAVVLALAGTINPITGFMLPYGYGWEGGSKMVFIIYLVQFCIQVASLALLIGIPVDGAKVDGRLWWTRAVLLIGLIPSIATETYNFITYAEYARFDEVYNIYTTVLWVLRYILEWWLILVLFNAAVRISTAPQRYLMLVLIVVLWVWVSPFYKVDYAIGNWFRLGSASDILGYGLKVLEGLCVVVALVVLFTKKLSPALPSHKVEAPKQKKLWLLATGATVLGLYAVQYARHLLMGQFNAYEYLEELGYSWRNNVADVMYYLDPALLGGVLWFTFWIMLKTGQQGAWQFLWRFILFAHLFIVTLWLALLNYESAYLIYIAKSSVWWLLLLIVPLLLVGLGLSVLVLRQLKSKMPEG